MTSELTDVRREVAIANRVLANLGLATGLLAGLGHASMRLPGNTDRFVVKGRQYAIDSLASMRPEDMVECDLEGYLVDAAPGIIQCLEVKIHSCIYQTRPDIQSIVHVHPRFTVLMSVLGRPLVPMCMEGVTLVQKPLPVYPHVKTIQSHEEGADMAKELGDDKIVLLFGHGAVTTGASLEDSVMSMARLEEQARMNYYAFSAMGPDYPRIPDALINEITDRPNVEELDHFKDALAGGPPQMGGQWNYHVTEAARGL
jgi:L-fuculose-phosphate aldolase